VDISPEMIALVVVLTVLGVLFTGPGMWSENWGWKFLDRWNRRRRGEDASKTGDGHRQ
jgi:hypothetical protein